MSKTLFTLSRTQYLSTVILLPTLLPTCCKSHCLEVYCVESDEAKREECISICSEKCLRPCYLQLLAYEAAVSVTEERGENG